MDEELGAPDDRHERDRELRRGLPGVGRVVLGGVEVERLQLVLALLLAALSRRDPGVGHVGDDEDDGSGDPGGQRSAQRPQRDAEREERQEAAQVAPGGRTVVVECPALVAAAREGRGAHADEEHRQGAEQEGRSDDRSDRDVLRLLAPAAEHRDQRQDRLGQRGADGGQQRADRAGAEFQPVAEPLDGVGEADRAADNEHEGSEEQQHGHPPGLPTRHPGDAPFSPRGGPVGQAALARFR
jgi:hypothetical protein